MSVGIIERFRSGTEILAPLTKGGNLPFRRLCAEVFGAEILYSEMAYARYVVKGEARERALLRRHPSERYFGVQFAALQTEEALSAAQIAQDMGADFIDINCGCPIDDVVRRGLGSALLRRPKALFRLVEHLAKNLTIPVTVKIRLGFKEGEENALEIARGVEAAGAQALTIHGRTREQRYARAADWQAIRAVAESISIPVIGNGDILTHYEAETRRQVSGVASVMIGRGALIKPWIFSEIRSKGTDEYPPLKRIEILCTFTRFLKEHFGDDELGTRRIMKFLPWHLELFSRYRYLPQTQYSEEALRHPLIQSRIGNMDQVVDPVQRVLESAVPEVHASIAQILLSETEPANIFDRLEQLARELPTTEDIRDRSEFREIAG